MSSWLDLESTTAPSPNKDGDPLRIAFSTEIRGLFEKQNKRTPLFQAWCHVLGKLPPINNIEKIREKEPGPTLTTLFDSVACFGGIMRPHDNEKDGKSVLIYVLNIEYSIEYSPGMACVATSIQVPKNTVFTVQVRTNHPLQNNIEGVNGILTRIEPVFNSPGNPHLPANFDSRYLERFW